MTITAAHVGGQGTTGSGSVTSDSWTSTAGSTIIVVGHYYNATGAAAAGDCTDSKSNSYSLATPSIIGGSNTPGCVVYYNIGGTRGSSHTVTINPVNSSGDSENVGVLEITSTGTISFDATTGATASDGNSPFVVTAAGAISGTQVAIGGLTIDVGVNDGITQPAGYTNIINQPDGTSQLVSNCCYKIGETGTPAIQWTSGGVIAAREIFVTFQETASAAAATAYNNPASLRPPGLLSPRGLLVPVGDPTATSGGAVFAQAGSASGTGSAGAAAGSVSSGPGSGAASGSSGGPTAALSVHPGSAVGTGTAYNPAINNAPKLYATSASANGHYIKDQNGDPYFVQGNSPQNMVPNATLAEMATFFADQAGRGFNSAQVHIVYNFDADAETSTTPFQTNSTLNVGTHTAYWGTIDSMLDLAESYGFTLWLTVLDDITCGGTVASVSDANCFAFGQFLGARYASRPNIVWAVGNDYSSGDWSRDPKYENIIDGIRDQGDTHLMTLWLDVESSDNNTNWDGRNDLVLCYRYDWPPYYQTGDVYQLTRTGFPKPTFWGEGTYYDEKNATTTPPLSTNLELRKLAWWGLPWGAIGHFFGTHAVWQFGDWQTEAAESQAVDIYAQLGLIPTEFAGLDGWQDLVPDFSHVFQTGGRGTFEGGSAPELDNDNFSTAAFVSGGTLGVAYFPTSRGSITFDTSQLSGTVTAYWLDPTDGSHHAESTPSTPTHPGNNADGDPDWVLVFEGTSNATANAGLASGTGAANSAAGAVSSSGGAGSASGAAGGPTSSLSTAAGLASASGSAFNAAPTNAVVANPTTASGSGAAGDAAGAVSSGPGSGSASGSASGPSSSMSVSIGEAAGTGTAFDPSIQVSQDGTASAGLASGSGSAGDAAGSVSGSQGAASASGSAGGPAGSLSVSSGSASGTGTAFDPSIDSSSAGTANAGVATGTGTANDPSSAISGSSGSASGSGSAFDETVQAGSGASAGFASGSGAAGGAAGSVAGGPGAGSASGAAGTSGASLSVAGGAATGSGAASNAAPAAGQFAYADLASGSGSAGGPTGAIQTTAGVAAGTGIAYNPTAGPTTITIPPGPTDQCINICFDYTQVLFDAVLTDNVQVINIEPGCP